MLLLFHVTLLCRHPNVAQHCPFNVVGMIKAVLCSCDTLLDELVVKCFYTLK